LRGCIGNIVTTAPLYLTVRNMAIAAASQDSRFLPVGPKELGDIDVEISVLSKPRRTMDVNEIQMGVHGVIIRRGMAQGVFLPQVGTETGWSREEFLSQLCAQKAGLPPNAWKDPRTEIRIFTADVFSEKEIK
jgi:AmmeMemoRadiSam system protein A